VVVPFVDDKLLVALPYSRTRSHSGHAGAMRTRGLSRALATAVPRLVVPPLAPPAAVAVPVAPTPAKKPVADVTPSAFATSEVVGAPTPAATVARARVLAAAATTRDEPVPNSTLETEAAANRALHVCGASPASSLYAAVTDPACLAAAFPVVAPSTNGSLRLVTAPLTEKGAAGASASATQALATTREANRIAGTAPTAGARMAAVVPEAAETQAPVGPASAGAPDALELAASVAASRPVDRAQAVLSGPAVLAPAALEPPARASLDPASTAAMPAATST